MGLLPEPDWDEVGVQGYGGIWGTGVMRVWGYRGLGIHVQIQVRDRAYVYIFGLGVRGACTWTGRVGIRILIPAHVRVQVQCGA